MKEFLAKGHWVKVIIFFFKVCVTALPHGSDICHGINRSFQARHMIIYYTTVNVRGLSSDAETFYPRSSLGDHLKVLGASDYMALDFLT